MWVPLISHPHPSLYARGPIRQPSSSHSVRGPTRQPSPSLCVFFVALPWPLLSSVSRPSFHIGVAAPVGVRHLYAIPHQSRCARRTPPLRRSTSEVAVAPFRVEEPSKDLHGSKMSRSSPVFWLK
jgi:hypothetical protein